MAIPCDDYMHWQRTLSDQATSTVDTRWVELDELEILEGKTGTSNHGVTVTRARVRRGAAEVRSSVPTRRENGLVRAEAVKGAVLEVEGDHTHTLAVLHDEIEREVLDKEVGVVAEGLAVEGMEEGVTGTVGGGGATVRLTTLAVLQRLATEGALVDLALLRA